MRREDLSGDVAFQFEIERPEHGAHAAAADHLQHLVAAQAAEDAGLVGRLQVLDGEIDLRPLRAAGNLVSRQGRVQFIFGKQSGGFLAPCRVARHAFQRGAAVFGTRPTLIHNGNRLALHARQEKTKAEGGPNRPAPSA